MRPKLLLATINAGKVREYQTLLRDIPFDIVTPADVGISITVAETGRSFAENARLKATTFARLAHFLTLADDSGLEVDALGGEPGTLSHRYAGADVSDRALVDYLLLRLKNVPSERRTARFRCVIAIADPDGKVEFCEGECPGLITLEPRGDQGFGYDPIFYIPELTKTMAQLPLETKNRISHRGRAAEEARRVLQKMAEKVS